MRLPILLCVIVLLTGISAAQDTNFPAGPQYRIAGSPIFLQPIETPSLSLSTLPATTATGSEAEEQPVPASPLATQPNLTQIYYGSPTENAPVSSDIEIISPEAPSQVPPSIFDPGVTAIVDQRSLRESGYGLTLGQAAAFWKAHKHPAARLYTNADVARLHRG
jgi:hypothetical protein